MKLGCHCVMFAEKLAEDTEKVIREIAGTGFQGVEAGARFLPLENRAALMKTLENHGLQLAAIHYGSPEWKTNPQKAIEGVKAEAAFMAKTANPNINFSYMQTDDEDFVNTAKIFNEAALACQEYGVSLNYHNHAHEFENGGRFYYALMEHAPDLHFAFDLGWVKRGGFEPLEVLKQAAGRCAYVHLRDPDDGPENCEMHGQKFYRFPDLGSGQTDLRSQLAFLKGYLPENGWVVVEYEGGEPDVQRYIRAKQLIDTLL